MRLAACLLVIIAAVIIPPISYATERGSKIVAFTFDDGPRPEFLAKALPYFAREKIPATFFVIGGKARQHPGWILRAFREGHGIENHTMNHVCLAKPSSAWTSCKYISAENAINEVRRTIEVIEKLTGYRTRFLRPPHFAMTAERKREIETALGIRVLIHGSNSIGSLDWVYRDPIKVAAQVANTARNRGDDPYVIVFHENDVTLDALPAIIGFFRSTGYEFVRLDEFVKLAPQADI